MASDDNISIFDSDEEEDAKEETRCRKRVWIGRSKMAGTLLLRQIWYDD